MHSAISYQISYQPSAFSYQPIRVSGTRQKIKRALTGQ
jgi:hypothetical protein